MKDYLLKRYKSFKYAFAGLKLFFLEANFKIHLFATAIVMIVSIFCDLSATEYLFIISSIFLVIIAESINTIIEKLMDRITEAYDVKIKAIKDMSAAFVLIAAVYAIVVAGVIFIPKIQLLLNLGV